ncbi:MAG: bifunctional (p)ppGpp synthetase/guanosine-3',5'-bis(diphosphate) 3'-pyrophosphohydrolase [Proteobacteria bacterium]|nr:bifunctional (p)ppGpp synthetase/guanosine-3',5'-bis(diphosphate) 3'-pyrophosphohydrolase [Pseudomonadota bacterium]
MTSSRSQEPNIHTITDSQHNFSETANTNTHKTLDFSLAAKNKEKEKIDLLLAPWIELLSILRSTPANRTLLSEYLLERFSGNTELYYSLLILIKNALLEDSLTFSKPLCMENIADNYLRVLSPLAERFGIFEEKSILDTLCFKVLHPAEYLETEKFVINYQDNSEKYLAQVSSILANLMHSKGYDVEIQGRYKSTYSIFCKLNKKNRRKVSLDDIFAFRVILNNASSEDCFAVLNILHDYFSPVSTRFKDYVTIPKINGYESIHTCLTKVIPELDIPIEVQIRTRLMHDYAENGLASHWIYAKGKRSESLSTQQKRLLEQFQLFASTAAQNRKVYFLSFEGDLYTMPEGVTVLDFAYALHTDLGNKAVGALINDGNQDLSYRLKDNDKVKIINSEQNNVRKEWADFVFNNSTKKKIYANSI